MLRENETAATDNVSALTTGFTNPGRDTQTNNGQRENQTPGLISLNNVSQMMSRRQVGAYHTILRKRSISKVLTKVNNDIKICNAELDTYADTCGVNNVACILECTGQVAEVSGFVNSLETIQDIPIVKATVAYDYPESGETIILVINQALYYDNQLDNILLNPNQMRFHGLIVNNIPKHLSQGKSSYSIFIEDETLCIPLNLNGIISYFSVQTPTTSEAEWNPYSNLFQGRESELEGSENNISIKV